MTTEQLVILVGLCLSVSATIILIVCKIADRKHFKTGSGVFTVPTTGHFKVTTNNGPEQTVLLKMDKQGNAKTMTEDEFNHNFDSPILEWEEACAHYGKEGQLFFDRNNTWVHLNCAPRHRHQGLTGGPIGPPEAHIHNSLTGPSGPPVLVEGGQHFHNMNNTVGVSGLNHQEEKK